MHIVDFVIVDLPLATAYAPIVDLPTEFHTAHILIALSHLVDGSFHSDRFFHGECGSFFSSAKGPISLPWILFEEQNFGKRIQSLQLSSKRLLPSEPKNSNKTGISRKANVFFLVIIIHRRVLYTARITNIGSATDNTTSKSPLARSRSWQCSMQYRKSRSAFALMA